MTKWMKSGGVLLLMAFLLVVLAACGGGGTSNEGAAEADTGNAAEVSTDNGAETSDDNGQEAVTEEDEELSGSVIIDGSGTVYPLMAHIAEQYMSEEQPGVSVQVGRAGSSAGFNKFIAGETDFSDASRPIKDEEVAQLEEQGLTTGEDVLEFRLAYDGLTMVINKENNWATEMTKDEIVNMYISGFYAEDDVVNWSDVRPDWPERPISFYGPNENHGTYEFFFENILEEQPLVSTVNLEQEYSTLVDLVANDVDAIAFFGYGYYQANTDKLTAVAVDFGAGPVLPADDTIGEDLDYAEFTRPVFTYLNAQYAAEKPQVLDYAYYVLEAAPLLASENGFAPLPASVYEEYKVALDAIGQ